MIRLMNRATYLLPNSEIVQATWRPEHESWLPYQSQTNRSWAITPRGRILYLRYGLKMAGYADDSIDTGWNARQLDRYGEPAHSLLQAQQVTEIESLHRERLESRLDPFARSCDAAGEA